MEPQPPPDPGALRRERAAAAGFFALLALALTWPLLTPPFSHVPLGANDLWQNYWNFWWWREALLARGVSPYATDLLYSPGGASLAFHTHSPVNILLAFPILATGNVAAALSFATVFSFFLAAFGGYVLARMLSGDARAAIVAGLAFAYFPHHYEQSLEHLNLASYGAMPLFLAAFLRLLRDGGRRWILAAGSAFALNALFSLHYGLMLLPGGAVLLGLWMWRAQAAERVRVLRDTALSALLALALLLPAVYPMLAEILAGETYFVKPPVHKPIDPLFLLLPSEQHPLWGALFEPAYARWRSYPSVGFTAYLGLIPLLLVVWGCFSRRPPPAGADPRPSPGFQPGFWWFWTALYLVLSFGAELRIAGRDTGIPLPFALLSSLPFLETLRVANRFIVPAMLGVSLLAAWGAARLLARSQRPNALAMLLAGLVILDFLWVPYPVQEPERPDWIQALEDAPPGPLLDIPSGHRARGAEDMYYQTLHRRPLVGGYVSCTPPHVEERVERYPILHLIFEGRPKVRPPVEPELRRLLNDLPIAVVVVHLDRVREDLEAKFLAERDWLRKRRFNPERGMLRDDMDAFRRALRRIWGSPYYLDRTVEIYRRPEGR